MFDDKTRSDDAFTAAMLHDLGQLITVVELPDRMLEAMARSQAEDIPFHEAEYAVMGTSHAEIGAYLLGLWGLPYPIVEAVANHHRPERVEKRTEFGTLEAVYLANLLTRDEEPDPGLVASCGIADRLPEWRELADVLRVQAV
jgi:HD-like signal output (HDOD) protein